MIIASRLSLMLTCDNAKCNWSQEKQVWIGKIVDKIFSSIYSNYIISKIRITIHESWEYKEKYHQNISITENIFFVF